jgi:hypothetical protein
LIAESASYAALFAASGAAAALQFLVARALRKVEMEANDRR